MRKYYEMMKSQMKIETAYVAWFWAGTFATVVKILILYYFWTAVYENRSSIAEMPLETMLTYAVIAALLGNFHFAGPGNQLAEQIQSGGVAVELLRPYDLINRLVWQSWGGFGMSLVRDMLPMLAVGWIFLGIQFPATGTGAVLFILSTLIGLFLAMYIDLILGVLAFWTVNIFGLRTLKNAILLFFTGSMVPVTMFPGWLQTLSQYMPFQSIVYVPVSIYTGTLAGLDALSAMLVQILWLALMWAVVRVIWSLAVRKVTVFGG
ncbi:ABC-2 family transporter protein [Tumebacillus sp. DT12]|uniref:ABC-2 family transporter protein n=1 Tax=Tumebacillus lacus TaxID=2995335 RepID=A0ABT3X176_9BACL|nr:ABC-2 family transporter protein [Tumebacillus lacus]MCX7570645.1 ABC-2 family transporter protein [Tumebacillus lacus]